MSLLAQLLIVNILGCAGGCRETPEAPSTDAAVEQRAETETTPIEPTFPPTAELRIQVDDPITGEPVEGAVVRVSGRTSRTDAAGVALFERVPVGHQVVQIRSTGRASQTRLVSLSPDERVRASWTPPEVGLRARVAALQTEQRLEDPTGSFQLTIEPGDLATLDGAVWTDAFMAELTVFDKDEAGHGTFPGGMQARDLSGAELVLETYGAVDIQLTTPEDEPLFVAAGESLEMRLRVGDEPEGALYLWVLDVGEGRWLEEPDPSSEPANPYLLVPVVEGSDWWVEASLIHLSGWNVDGRDDASCFRLDLDVPKPLWSGVEVGVVGSGYSERRSVVDGFVEVLGVPSSEVEVSLYLFDRLQETRTITPIPWDGEGGCGDAGDTLALLTDATHDAGAPGEAIVRLRSGACPGDGGSLVVRDAARAEVFSGSAESSLRLRGLSAGFYTFELDEDGDGVIDASVEAELVCAAEEAECRVLPVLEVATGWSPPGGCAGLPCVGSDCDAAVRLVVTDAEGQPASTLPVTFDAPASVEATTEDGALCVEIPGGAGREQAIQIDEEWFVVSLIGGGSCDVPETATQVAYTLGGGEICPSGYIAVPATTWASGPLRPGADPDCEFQETGEGRLALELEPICFDTPEGSDAAGSLVWLQADDAQQGALDEWLLGVSDIDGMSARDSSWGAHTQEIDVLGVVSEGPVTFWGWLVEGEVAFSLQLPELDYDRQQTLTIGPDSGVRFGLGVYTDDGYAFAPEVNSGTIQILDQSSSHVSMRFGLAFEDGSSLVGGLAAPLLNASQAPPQLTLERSYPLDGASASLEPLGELQGPSRTTAGESGQLTLCAPEEGEFYWVGDRLDERLGAFSPVYSADELPEEIAMRWVEREMIAALYDALERPADSWLEGATILGALLDGDGEPVYDGEVWLESEEGERIEAAWLDNDYSLADPGQTAVYAFTELADGARYTLHGTDAAGTVLVGYSLSLYAVAGGVLLPHGASLGEVVAFEDAQTWYADADGDGYGDPGAYAWAIDAPDGFVDNDGDCDDGQVALTAGSIWYLDADSDGYGCVDEGCDEAGDPWVLACEQPDGYAAEDGDCDDTAAAIHPGATEPDCADPTDYNCDGSTGYADDDADGFAACEDCDDSDAAIHPDAIEVCNGLDDDCDGEIDEPGAVGETAWYADEDSDDHGDAEDAVSACNQPGGYVPDDTDCDDNESASHPRNTEICDGIDNDCDGGIDNGAVDAVTWYADADADGYGDASASEAACDQSSGYVDDATDCDDGDDETFPSADERCDGGDNDCDGVVDEDATDVSTWYADTDGDDYGDPDVSEAACDQPAGYVDSAGDCDDDDANTHGGADEICGGEDEDCDGTVDEDGASDALTWYLDDDGDGYGDLDELTAACDQPTNYLLDATDCDDADAAVHPGAEEICDGLENDCEESSSSEAGIATFTRADGTIEDWTATLSGVSGAPAEVTASEAGELAICDGDWYVSLTIDTDLSIVGGGVDKTVLSGGAVATVIKVLSGSHDITLRGVTLSEGLGSELVWGGTSAGGGGLFCSGDSMITIDNSAIRVNTAEAGGGAFLEGCSLTATDFTLADNAASVSAGGLVSHGGDVVLDGVVVSDNDSPNVGGALIQGANITIVDSVFSGNSSSGASGGGLYLWGTDDDGSVLATISDTIFQSNYAYYKGGGVYSSCENSTGILCALEQVVVVMSGVVIEQNVAYRGANFGATNTAVTFSDSTISKGESDGSWESAYPAGGGIYIEDSVLVLEAVEILENEIGYGAAGLYAETSTVEGQSVLCSGNAAPNSAGGVYLDDTTATFTDSRFESNSSGGNGSAIYTVRGSLTLSGSSSTCVIADNTAGGNGAIYNDHTASGTIEVDGCDFSNNTPEDTYNNGTSYTWGTSASFSCDATSCY